MKNVFFYARKDLANFHPDAARAKKHMACCKNYKAYILKQVPCILKYMPYIFEYFKWLNNNNLQKSF